MPIILDPAADSWHLTDPTEEEKHFLVKLGIEYVLENYGEVAGQKIVEQAMKYTELQMSKTSFVVPEGGFQGQA